ncbi:MAG: hypothetical protein AABZ47_12500, partial [Planctomycetota bacterium]
MCKYFSGLLLVVFATATSLAADLSLTARSNGSSSIQVAPGAVVNYEIIGELSGSANGGLALFGVDVSFSGGPLQQANEPASPPMDNFVSSPTNTKGLANPAGYGGTLQNGVLRQVGGAQNTINNVVGNAPFPTGMVIEDVAITPQVLCAGSLTAPMTPGMYTLTLSNVFANVIKDGETGTPFYKTEQAGVGNITNLSIEVIPEETRCVSSSPSCDQSLWRTANNTLSILFDDAITAPAAGEVQVNELMAGGAFGADISGSFTFTVENGNTLRVRENGDSALDHRIWYAVRNTGAWSGVAAFKVDLVVMIGDANNDNRVQAIDSG